VHEGRTVAFCCANCLAKFQVEPARFPVTAK
jgi:YHS domain-containing protein